MNFFEKFLKKEVNAEDIHKYIDEWHNANTTKSVSEYLGMTKEQYGIFIRHPEKTEELRKTEDVAFIKKIKRNYSIKLNSDQRTLF